MVGAAAVLIALGGCNSGKDSDAQARRPGPRVGSPEQKAANAAKDRDAYAEFETKCDAGMVSYCVLAALSQKNGVGTAKNPAQARRRAEQLCERDVGAGCELVASFHEDDEKTYDAWHAKAAGAFTRRCDAGDGGACERLADLHKMGIGVAKDKQRMAEFHRKALKAYERACAKGEHRDCYGAAMAYKNAKGVAKNPAKAVRYLERACALDNSFGCIMAAEFHAGRHGGAKDKAKRNYYDYRGCLLAPQVACSRTKME